MNEHLTERFGRSKRISRPEHRQTDHAEVWLLPPKLNTRIREYYQGPPAEGGHWLARPEVPHSAELLDADTNSSSSSDSGFDIRSLRNLIKGAFKGKENYLSTHYNLLREDAVRPLREAVAEVRENPQADENEFSGQIGIYEKVHICATTISTRGIAIRVTFSLRRTGKKILWEQSKRLISGSLVVLSPANDMFNSQAIVATVAARPLSAVQQNPPEVDLFFARTDELEIDPAIEYVMVEERSGFYEASRHTLLALQHMMKEPFPLSEHLVDAKREIPTPKYVLEQPKRDMTSLFRDNKHETYENVHILKQWPRQPQSDMDASQLSALQRILTKQLAIIQGPPGTGKTYVSVQAIKVMLANRHDDDPPIVIACQTNHAIDQILRHIAQFETEFVRLGGRSKDQGIIKERTLYELRNTISENPPAGCAQGMARTKMQHMQKEFGIILTPLKPDKKALDHRVLENFNILTKAQADSLENGASRWVQDKKSNPNHMQASPFTLWLGDKLVSVPYKQQPEEFGFDYEEADLEFEQLKEVEAENIANDEDFESLHGLSLSVADNFTCRKVQGMESRAQGFLSEQDMWRIPEVQRGAVYRHLQSELKKCIRDAFRKISQQYNEQATKRRIGGWEKDENIIKRQKLIGMTTTGFSKYRALISALQPKIVLIEEAAETLEAPVTATCVPSLQHLILVGDHQQLRPHVQVKAFENEPYFLNVSMFERLVNNKVGFEILSKQRRMIPEIRRILYPIYKNRIKDHVSVTNPENRPNVPGMGGVNSWFFTHQWPEARDDQMSCYNQMEVDMIVGFFGHLRYNGVDAEDITILTFYNGQRKRILRELRHRALPQSESQKFNVVTVDSYQGEENKVVLLSLVRSNDNKAIGFLDVVNRVCVALSRAQCGFYIFGNGMLLYNESKTWARVIKIIAGKMNEEEAPKFVPNRLDNTFPIRCKNHNNVVEIIKPDDWDHIYGGCLEKCAEVLPCGHPCQLTCHPFPDEEVNCQLCLPAKQQHTSEVSPTLKPQSTSGSTADLSNTSSWESFAQEEPKRVQAQIENYQSPSPQASKAAIMPLRVVESKPGNISKKHFPNGLDRADSRSYSLEKRMASVGPRKKWVDTVRMGGDSSSSQSAAEEDLIDLK
ncbi:hypothetical protein DOTSEDRAFT_52452 [Lecanosticta acicola]|uniref:Uncharacterized protein n=1 Tax=Lecanosticta acicola TaxID=111012 RepID=A0AAI8Z0L1_9PEZI|nr:hypothetical protein DOTSEDRAFT_52452 [Lecanosticta acicola]